MDSSSCIVVGTVSGSRVPIKSIFMKGVFEVRKLEYLCIVCSSQDSIESSMRAREYSHKAAAHTVSNRVAQIPVKSYL